LTRLRSALVCTEQLAEFASALKIGPAMLLGRGEERAGGRERPLLLCATLEALVGALYLQTDIPTIQQFIYPLLEKAVDAYLLRPDLHDPKSRLQEWSQGQKLGIPRYLTVRTSGLEHEREFEVEVHINDQIYGRGSGRSKQEAARNAAQAALEYIEKNE
jgi:ribonuclease-3